MNEMELIVLGLAVIIFVAWMIYDHCNKPPRRW